MPLPPRRGASRFGCLMLLAAVALLWGAGQGCYTRLRNRQPTAMTMRQYQRAHPNAEWLELRDAVVYLPGAGHIYNRIGGSRTDATTIYVPVYAEEPARDDQPTNVVLKTDDTTLVSLFNQINRAADDSAVARIVRAHAAAMAPTRTVKGLVQFGIDLDDKDRELVRTHVAHTDDFVVLAEGAEPPGSVLSFVLGAAGVVVLLLALRQLAKQP